jgi:5-methylcytosine-specific restriction endonuclease McrA
MAENGEKRDPSSHRTPTQIKRLDRGYNATPEMKRKRAMNNAARAKVVAVKGESAVRGKDVDHKKPLRQGGGNSLKNLRVIDKKRNRGWRDGV